MSNAIRGFVADLREDPAAARELLTVLREACPDMFGSGDSEPDDWLPTKEAASYIGVHHVTLKNWAAQGLVPSDQDAPGGRRYFKRSDLDHWRRMGGARQHRAGA